MLRFALSCAWAVTAAYSAAPEETNNEWEMKFHKISDPLINPVLGPIEDTSFLCPVRRKQVNWEAKDVFNPAAVVKDGKVHLLYRAEDRLGAYSGTSRIGLAWSEDGYTFEHRLTEPVLYPAHDDMNRHEWDGGCEDPRVVESPSGEYVMTYTSYDGTARLCVATSRDLLTWHKHGPAFAHAHGHAYRNAWTKSGSILVEPQADGRLVAVKVNGTYWMYWGENDIHVATSDDLYNWVPLMSDDPTHEYRGRPDHQDLPTGATKPISVLTPRRGKFDSNLVEPGPPAILREDGILFIYNSKNVACDNEENAVCVNGESDTELAPGTYSAGQALFSRTDPTKLLKRSEENFFKPTEDFEITGQVGNVCFLEGMVFFKNKWMMYYGTADSKIAVAETSDYDHTGKLDPRKRGSSSKKPLFQPVRENFSPEGNNRRQQTDHSSSSKTSTAPKKTVLLTSDNSASKPQNTGPTSASALHPADVSDVTTPEVSATPATSSPSSSSSSVPEETKIHSEKPAADGKKKTTTSKKVEEKTLKKKEKEEANLRKEADVEAVEAVKTAAKTGETKKKNTKEAPATPEDKFML